MQPFPRRAREQFVFPGEMNGGGGSSSVRPGGFAWARDVAPPPPEDNRSPEDDDDRPLQQQQQQSGGKDCEKSAGEAGAAGTGRSGSESSPWNVAMSVPPSKAVRDGVQFRGLGVLLFLVDESQRQPAVRVFLSFYRRSPASAGCGSQRALACHLPAVSG